MKLDLTTLALLWVAGSVILVPLLILAVRLAVVPLLETLGRPRTPMGIAAEERLARLEESVARMARDLERLANASAAPRGS